MSSTVHEIDLTSRVASWINQLAETNGIDFPIGEARIEVRSVGSQKRRDLTLYDRNGYPCLTGEVKLPWASDGHSPYSEDVVVDAREKAEQAGVEWFFTWNVNELLLWELGDVGALGAARTVERYQIANIHRREDLDNPKIVGAIRDGIERFVVLFARTLRGERGVDGLPPDIYFIHSLESFLERPIQLTRMELARRYEKPKVRERIDTWMRDRQGWSLGGDEQELLLRAARFTNFTVANRLIFYEALRKRFAELPKLKIPIHVDNSERLFDQLRAYFDEAKHITGDYETIFGVDPTDIGDRMPFYENAVVESWRALEGHVHRFNFSHLEYDVIGQIFERLIGPEERHKYGQYYTRPEVVDLINAFCIRHGEDRVMDPGCGGGTFLVRAYARKRHLTPRLDHLSLLRGIYGVDISRFAVHLSSMNLAARDLVEAQNYPRVVRSDFFDLSDKNPILHLPDRDGETIEITASRLDAVIGNPPYVRQEDIPREKKNAYRALVKREVKLDATGRSDLHIYFWGHAVNFLKSDGWLGFLTSSQWLDVEYGFPLQYFLLERFRIAAIIESRIEPWFVGARVQTAVTVAQRERDEKKRNDNIIRFVEIRHPLTDVLGSDGTSVGAIAAADKFRQIILQAETDVTCDGFRVRCVRQGDLVEEGLRNGQILKGKRIYAGVKWGIPLRAPDIWKQLQEVGANRWCQIGGLTEVRRGITTGADKFFYVDDHTEDALSIMPDAVSFEAHYGASRADVEMGKVKITKNGYSEVWPIESRYLEPVVHSLMHIDAYEVGLEHCKHLALVVSKGREALGGTFIAKYLNRGEELAIHKRPTCSSRTMWYDLTFARRARLLWPKSHQYRHCVPVNPNLFIANCNLYTIDTGIDSELASAVLNSSLVVLSKHLYGRPVGVEGNLKTEVVDVNMMLVPDWTRANKRIKQRLVDAFKLFRNRKVVSFLSDRRRATAALTRSGKIDRLEDYSDLSEFDQKDRHELDDAVLELLGVRSTSTRNVLRERLYECLQELYEDYRRKEEQAIVNKTVAKGRDKLTPQVLATDLLNVINREHAHLLSGYRDLSQEDGDLEVEGIRVPGYGTAEIVDDMLTTGVRFTKGRGQGEIVKTRSVDQARLIMKIVELGEGGRNHFVPVEPIIVRKQIKRIDRLIRRRQKKVMELIKERTNDPEISRKALDFVMARL